MLSLLLLLASAAPAEDWPRWRGDGSGITTAKHLPEKWSATENVRWKTKLPGEGVSSPIVWKDRIFLTAALDTGNRRQVLCLDTSTGKLLWTGEIKHDRPEHTSAVTGHAASTPVTDGKHVIAWFGNAGAVCFDMDGKKIWHHEVTPFESDVGLASSPILWRDRVILVCDHDGDRFTSFDSYLTALDLKTGKEVWKTARDKQERSFSTPLIVPYGKGSEELIVPSQDCLRAYDPATGKQRWTMKGLTPWVTPSPVYGHGMVFVVSGKNGPVHSVKPGGTGEVKAVWEHPNNGPYVSSPLLFEDYLYTTDELGFLTCYDAKTGKRQYRQRLGGKFTASPSAGDGKIYCSNEDGETFVVKPGPKFEQIAKNELGEELLASPAYLDCYILLRGNKHLYCIGSNRR